MPDYNQGLEYKMKSPHTKAFTMVELVFAIVVLGIVASLVSSIIVQTYESYIIQRAMHRAGLKTELAVNQIANRLAYRINMSLRGSDENGTTTMPLNQIDSTIADDYPVLEWIGYDNDGFSAKNPPGWSGFVDLGSPNTDYNKIFSIGSDSTGFETTVLDNLAGTAGGGSPAIYFMDTYTYRVEADGTSHDYNTTCMYASGANSCMFPVTSPGKTMTIAGGDIADNEMKYTEFYQLAASAYAVAPENPHTLSTGLGVWDLMLHSHYQPWDGDSFSVIADGISNLLLKNISVFRFNQAGDSIRIKICSVEVIGNQNISICKEKAVIR